ncbi:anti-sigma-K factor RskA [Lysinibacillus composti]|uniref:Uncharacterized protein n=1 Tax=Lysinibacillus composti TaxID=720633 RepID=A0A3N9UJ21_9BACI|nr:hypothetical protein [Lysinibacillus composti]MBM7607537.1 anti-sigma-K factor RskA [Lysinibacillus composti]RQW75955.1 hypothetical protein EBB45_04885 [Lysinibacillus composti]
MFKRTINTIKDSERTLSKFQAEYNEIAARNSVRSNLVRSKMAAKSDEFINEKSKRSKHFDIIRNK